MTDWRDYTPGQVCESMLGRDCLSGAVRLTGRAPDILQRLIQVFSQTELKFEERAPTTCEGSGHIAGAGVTDAHLHLVPYATRDVVVTYELKLKMSLPARLLPLLNMPTERKIRKEMEQLIHSAAPGIKVL